jgi:ATP-dependent RNA helicase DeaD
MPKVFRDLGISEEILKVIKEDGFEKPSEIQSKTIPLVLQGKDVIGGSATGSGKTLAFAAGIINNTEHGKGVQALILAPTRELAEQVAMAIKHFSKYKPLKVVSIYGGLSINPQIEDLRRADIVVGTPGRILDHLERDTLILDSLKTLVLDEADRMLDMGFIDDVLTIIKACPKHRQTMLFSATIYDEVVFIASKYMNNPVEVAAESRVDPKKLNQVYYDVPDDMKFSLLAHLLKKEKSDLVMVFCNTRRNTGFVVRNLSSNGIPAVSVHGGYTQAKRNQIMEDFHSKKIRVLVCTDVAARGLDIEGISHVYNYDIPDDVKDYVHRIGRTARAGKEGKAIILLSSHDYESFNKIDDDNSLNVVKAELPHFESIIPRSYREDRSRGSDGRAYRFGHRQDFHRSGDYRRPGSGPRRGFGGPRPFHRRDDSGRDRPQGQRNEGTNQSHDNYHRRDDYHGRDDRRPRGRFQRQGNRNFNRKPNYNLG